MLLRSTGPDWTDSARVPMIAPGAGICLLTIQERRELGIRRHAQHTE